MAAARKAALVTGAGRNIGRACVLGLAEDGFNIVLNGSSDRAACERVAQEAGKLGAETLVAYIDGKKPAGPKVFIPHVIVDKANVDQFLPK